MAEEEVSEGGGGEVLGEDTAVRVVLEEDTVVRVVLEEGTAVGVDLEEDTAEGTGVGTRGDGTVGTAGRTAATAG